MYTLATSYPIAVLFAVKKSLCTTVPRDVRPLCPPTRRPRAPVQRNRIGSARRFFKPRAARTSRQPRTTTVRVNTAVFARAPLLCTPTLQVAGSGLLCDTWTQSVQTEQVQLHPETVEHAGAAVSHAHSGFVCC